MDMWIVTLNHGFEPGEVVGVAYSSYLGRWLAEAHSDQRAGYPPRPPEWTWTSNESKSVLEANGYRVSRYEVATNTNERGGPPSEEANQAFLLLGRQLSERHELVHEYEKRQFELRAAYDRNQRGIALDHEEDLVNIDAQIARTRAELKAAMDGGR